MKRRKSEPGFCGHMMQDIAQCFEGECTIKIAAIRIILAL